MNITYQIYLISDSTGETIDRIFLALKAQFNNFKYEDNQYSFARTENQILKILELAKKQKNPIVLYTIVDSKLAKFLEEQTRKKKNTLFRCFRGTYIKFFKTFTSKSISCSKRTT